MQDMAKRFNCMTNEYNTFTEGDGAKGVDLSDWGIAVPLRLKAKKTAGQHCISMARLFAMGLHVNNSEATVTVYWN